MIKECAFQFEAREGVGRVGCGLTVTDNIVCECNQDICPIYQLWKMMSK